MKDYKRILEGVVNIINTTEKSDIGFTNICSYIGENCPELKESEDEKIRKELIAMVRLSCTNGDDVDKKIAWIEKQGEQKPAVDTKVIIPKFRVGDIVKSKSQPMLSPRKIISIGKDCYWCEDRGCIGFAWEDDCEIVEQNPTDKIEPKFKVGDWVIYECGEETATLQITRIVGETYVFSDNSTLGVVDEDALRLWDITKDAKKGDVLSDETTIFIFKDLLSDGSVMSYCDCDTDSGESDVFCPLSVNLMCSKITPAAKEQRDTLMKAMTDAGYTFDFEKKELKKIENEIEISFGAKDSELQEDIYYIPKGFHAEIDDDKVVIKKGEKPTAWSEDDEKKLLCICAWIKDYPRIADFKDEMYTVANNYVDWLKSLKDRVQPQPKQEWSEEDYNEIETIACHLDNTDNECMAEVLRNIRDKYYSQSQWKPSEGQLECLGYAIEKAEKDWSPLTNNRIYLTLKALKEQLEKLQ